MQNQSIKIIISGGGTGGHVFPAIAIAEALKKLVPEIDILFVGAKGKLEMEKVPQAGFRIEGLWISGLQRRLTLKNLSFPFKLISSLWKSHWLLRQFRPDVVIGVGGYASGPVLKMATRRGIPILILEQNSYPGLANRLIASQVQRICVAYPGMERFFEKSKIVHTGNPVRAIFENLEEKKAAARQHYGLETDRPVVLLTGGSLGARSLNQGIMAQYELLRTEPDIQLLWQCGKFYEQECINSQTATLPNVRVSAFLDRMDLAYAAADVVIARAGALTISELCLAHQAAVLIPSPNVAEDHQTKNAQALVQQQAAILIKDEQADQALPKAIALLHEPDLLQQLRSNIVRLARPQAAEEIAREALALTKSKL